MELVTWTPFDSLNKVQSRINGLFDENFGRSWSNAAAGSAWYPAVDILESKDAYVLRAELPGMNKEDFNLEVKEGTLTLTGERKFTKPAEGVQYRKVERVNGKFVRSFTLPETVKHDGIQATYKDGILEIHIPKAEEAKPRQIQISVH
ncbi:MAG TPA: Hsp20/alpha crystallin family protein [Candidatus Polarisedimenticolaceae bacterium]|nr:Hsp20/alpha crystallin family protein [Candidatus Polarisedimenticolaceae bacterium]